jgi:aspartate aminotransferase-like enzyme
MMSEKVIDKKKLERFTANVLAVLKAVDDDYWDLSTDVFALKEMLQEISGEKFQPIFDRHRAVAVQKVAALRADAQQTFGEMARQLKDGSAF